ncbi:MAG: ABC-type multidrug transport system, ATPase component, partial [Prosthecobacter sp.]|nr:ABC-type multidrug transport system, ATPase component [Prosthecobacter sp.]
NEWVDMYLELDKSGTDGRKNAETWEKDYLASPCRPQPGPEIPLVHDQGTAPPAPRPGFARTLTTLMSRQWAILKADMMNLAFLMAQALAIAVLVGWVAESAGLRSFLSVVAVLWFGCSNAAQQIVGEAPIFRRERVCGLGLNVYLGSKVIFIFLITALQCVLLFGTVTIAGNLFHSLDSQREALLEDERFGGGEGDAAYDPASTPGHGKNLLVNAFEFEEKDAADLAARFPAKEVPAAEGFSHLDEAAIERTAQAVAGQLVAASIPFKSIEARNFVKSHLLPSATPPAPPQASKPGKFRNECMLALIKMFGLQDNVLDSKSHVLKDSKGEPLREPVTRKLRKLPPVSLASVILVSVSLRFGALLGAAMVGVALGLAISSIVSSSTQAAMVVPLILIPQILFGGFVVTRPEMSVATRMVAQFIPSSAAQRISEVASIYGQSVPGVTNRTKVPVFIKGGIETVKWKENGEEKSEDYEKLAVHNTAFQNLIVNPALIGQRKKELEDGDGESREKDNVKRRRDIEPYMQGISCTNLSPARNAAFMLFGWLVVCYAASIFSLNRKQPL